MILRTKIHLFYTTLDLCQPFLVFLHTSRQKRNATKEERDAGYDIADFLLREETKEAILNRLITLNPALKTLVETFDLQLVDVKKAPFSATVQHAREGLFKR